MVSPPPFVFKNVATILILLLTIANVCGNIYRVEYAPLAQLDRVTGYEPVGQGFESLAACQEKRPFSNGLFSIQSEGLACNLTAGEYVIAEGVWHHASACISPSD